MTFPVFPISRCLDPHVVSPGCVQGAMEGHLVSQRRYRCMSPWHLEAAQMLPPELDLSDAPSFEWVP